MRFLSCGSAAALLCLLASAVSAQSLTPAPGPHAVGLRIVQQADASRGATPKLTMFDEGKALAAARPMQTLVWYPAQASGTAHVRYLDYLQSSLSTDDFSITPQQLADGSKQWAGNPAAQASMLAVRDARAVAGSFPVVIYAPSFNADASENADLCEYLASHGYIVIASASRGARTRGMTDDVEGVEAQAADIAWLASYASTVPGADLNRLAVAGFSWGGLANVFAAARSTRIKALVSLDGSVRYYPQLIGASGSVTPANTAVPMLSIGARPPSMEQLTERDRIPPPSFLNKMVFSDVYMASMQPMEHRDFASQSIRMSTDASFVDYSRDEVRIAYSWTVRYTRTFLDAYLKQDAAALAFLKAKPDANGVPAHLMTMKVRPASATAPSKAGFVTAFKHRHFTDAAAIYDAMVKSDPGFKLYGTELKALGEELLRKQQPKGAIELFKLGIGLAPRWGDLQNGLGEAYEAAGEPKLALAAYEQALVLDPNNTGAAARVKILRASNVSR
jgi:dienelactone hydrolase